MTSINLLVFFFTEGDLLGVDFTLPVIFVLFIVLAFILNILIFNPLLRVIDEREKLTSKTASGIQSLLEEYSNRLTKYQTDLSQARIESYQEVEKQRAIALQDRTLIIDGVKLETKENMDKAKQELLIQVKSAQEVFTKEARIMATSISTSILGRSIGET